MEFIQSSLGAFVVSAAIGSSIAFGLFLLRRASWDLARTLGWLSLAGLGLAGLSLFGVVFRGQLQGGDAAMNSGIFLVFALAGVAAGVGVAILIGFGQARILGRPLASGLFVGLPDAILLAFCIFWGMTFIHQTVEGPATSDWWQQELARRKKRERQLNEIPAPYRDDLGGALRQIDEERRFRRQNGLPEKETVPRDIENKMRNYWNETGTQAMPVPDRSAYLRAGAMRKGALSGILAGWILGAFALPWMFKSGDSKNRKPSSPREPGP